MFKRLGYQIGSALGSKMAGQRLQLEEWWQSSLDHQAGNYGPDLRELADQRRAEEKQIGLHNDRRGMLNRGRCWCDDPRCEL